MTFAWPPQIVTAFDKARRSEAPLSERLMIIAEVVGREFPGFTEIADAFVRRIRPWTMQIDGRVDELEELAAIATPRSCETNRGHR